MTYLVTYFNTYMYNVVELMVFWPTFKQYTTPDVHVFLLYMYFVYDFKV